MYPCVKSGLWGADGQKIQQMLTERIRVGLGCFCSREFFGFGTQGLRVLVSCSSRVRWASPRHRRVEGLFYTYRFGPPGSISSLGSRSGVVFATLQERLRENRKLLEPPLQWPKATKGPPKTFFCKGFTLSFLQARSSGECSGVVSLRDLG